MNNAYNGFKVGDTVRRVADYWGGMKPGDIALIIGLTENHLILEGYRKNHAPDKFELVKNNNSILRYF